MIFEVWQALQVRGFMKLQNREKQSSEISKELKLRMLKTMLEIRYFEQKLKELFMAAHIRGSMHVSIGEEATAAGACLAVRKEDLMTSTHRGHGHCLAKGIGLKEMLAEILGRETGCCGGRGGSMHLMDKNCGVMGTTAIVGGAIPVATGLGTGIQQLGLDKIVLCFFGDGACNQGSFHESVNLASVWKLPVIYVCVNNGFGDTTPYRQTVNVEDLSVRGAAYGIPGVSVDGNDVIAVYKEVCKAAEFVRAGKGPYLIECKTYRWEGHQLGDPCVYRTKEEVEQWKQKCPIKHLKEQMIRQGELTEQEFEVMDKQAAADVEDAAEFGINSPEPDPATVGEYLW